VYLSPIAGGKEVFAVVVRESGDAEQIDAGGEMVQAAVAPRVRQAPGFVSAYWMSDGRGGTLNVLAFESEDAAKAALEAARNAPRPPFMRLEAVDLFRVLASA
jgi:head-tail adaptor